METKLRQLIISRRTANGLSLDELSRKTDCRLVELRGYEEGLFTLAEENLCKVIKALAISENELSGAVGAEIAKKIISDCG